MAGGGLGWHRCALGALLLLMGRMAAAQAGPELRHEGAFSVRTLAGGVHVLAAPDSNTNIGIVPTPEGVILIDPMPGRPQLAALQQWIQQRLQPKALFILNTHAHEDHSDGNAFFVAQGARLMAMPLKLEGVRAVTLRSHSGADHVFIDPAGRWMFVGDLVDTSWHPTFYSGGVAGFIEAIVTLLAQGDEHTWVIPGHGPPILKSDLRAYLQDTLRWVARVRALGQQGLSVARMKVDDELLRLLQRFNRSGAACFVPDPALQRFIERTLAVIAREPLP